MRKIFSGGSDGQLGAVKVKPLSVPPSMGPTWKCRRLFKYFGGTLKKKENVSTLIATLSTHWPSMHKLKLSSPTNQSGDGTIRDASETCFFQNRWVIFFSSKSHRTIFFPLPWRGRYRRKIPLPSFPLRKWLAERWIRQRCRPRPETGRPGRRSGSFR